MENTQGNIPMALGEGQTRWMTPPVPVGFMRQFLYFAHLYNYIANVPGDVVEGGAGDGGTFAMLAYLVGREGNGRALFGFDSFEGWPEPSETDKSSPRNPQKGEWGDFRRRMVADRLTQSGILDAYPDLTWGVVQGFFEATLPLYRGGDRPIAFLHADCDLEPSYRTVLENLFPLVSPGGIVCFDEYHEMRRFPGVEGVHEKWPGATKAIDEYFAGRPERIEYYRETDKYYVRKIGV